VLKRTAGVDNNIPQPKQGWEGRGRGKLGVPVISLGHLKVVYLKLWSVQCHLRSFKWTSPNLV